MRRRTRSSQEKRADLETLAKGLLEFETLSGDEIKDLLARQAADPRVGDRTGDAALVGGAVRRQGPSAASRRAARSAARAAGVGRDANVQITAAGLCRAFRLGRSPSSFSAPSICRLRASAGLSVSALRRSAIASSLRESARITAARAA